MKCPIEGCDRNKEFTDKRAMRMHLIGYHDKKGDEVRQLMDAENLEYFKQSNPDLVKSGPHGVVIKKIQNQNPEAKIYNADVTMVTQNQKTQEFSDEGGEKAEIELAPEKEVVKEPAEEFTGLQDKFKEIEPEIKKELEPVPEKPKPDDGYAVIIENLIREEEATMVLESQLCEHFTPEILKDEQMLLVFLGTIDKYITHAQHFRRFSQDLIKKVKENGHI